MGYVSVDVWFVEPVSVLRSSGYTRLIKIIWFEYLEPVNRRFLLRIQCHAFPSLASRVKKRTWILFPFVVGKAEGGHGAGDEKIWNWMASKIANSYHLNDKGLRSLRFWYYFNFTTKWSHHRPFECENYSFQHQKMTNLDLHYLHSINRLKLKSRCAILRIVRTVISNNELFFTYFLGIIIWYIFHSIEFFL